MNRATELIKTRRQFLRMLSASPLQASPSLMMLSMVVASSPASMLYAKSCAAK